MAGKAELTQDECTAIEQRSLALAKWGNLFMCVAGVVAALASRSDALLVDGLYSGVNFLAAIVAAFVGRSILRAPDRQRPFGYEADEAIYVTFRSLTLLGIITFAAINAVIKITTYATGGAIPDLIFGPIQVYMVAMVATCAFLAFWHYRSWAKTGRQSDILKTESRAAIIDGVISAGAGSALLAVTFLTGTALEILIPIADAVVVLVMACLIVWQPLKSFRDAFGELAGYATGAPHYKLARSAVQEVSKAGKIRIVDLAVTKLGRSFMIVAFLDPGRKINAAEVDELNESLTSVAAEKLKNVRTEIILTAQPRLRRVR